MDKVKPIGKKNSPTKKKECSIVILPKKSNISLFMMEQLNKLSLVEKDRKMFDNDSINIKEDDLKTKKIHNNKRRMAIELEDSEDNQIT